MKNKRRQTITRTRLSIKTLLKYRADYLSTPLYLIAKKQGPESVLGNFVSYVESRISTRNV